MLQLGLPIAVAVAVLDQLSKWWARDILDTTSGMIEVTGFFNLARVWNRGVSFGFLGSAPPPSWLLAGIAGLVSVGLVWWLARVDERWTGTAIGLIVGGAVGNIIDRLGVHGAVFDFLDFHLAGHHWPAFNLADAAIAVGVGLLLIDSLLIHRRRPTN